MNIAVKKKKKKDQGFKLAATSMQVLTLAYSVYSSNLRHILYVWQVFQKSYLLGLKKEGGEVLKHAGGIGIVTCF